MKLELNINSILTTVACFLITTGITIVYNTSLKVTTLTEKVQRIETEQARVKREYHPETNPSPKPRFALPFPNNG